MQKKRKVRIKSGARANKEGLVIELVGQGRNQGTVRVYIEELNKSYWYKPEDLEIIPFQTKEGDRIEITDVLGGITDVIIGATGYVNKEPEIIANSVEVEIELDDGKIIVWKESNLKVIDSDSADLVQVVEEVEVLEPEIVGEERDLQTSKTAELEKLESTIRKRIKAFYHEVGAALKQIKSERLYEQLGYENFDAYCQQRWGWKRTYVFYQIKAAETIENLAAKIVHPGEQSIASSSIPLPTNEKQLRVLGQYDREIQSDIWSRSLEIAGGQPPVKIIKEVGEVVSLEVKQKQFLSDSSGNIPDTEEFRSGELNNEPCQTFPLSSGDICTIQAGEESELKRCQGFWGVVTEVGEFSCNVEVYDRTVEWVKPEYLVKLEISQEEKERAVALMGRLRTIAEKEPVERMISAILLELAKRRDFKLAEREEQILALIERLVGIAID